MARGNECARHIESFAATSKQPPAPSPAAISDYQRPLLGIDAHGSFGGRAAPFCNSSMECLSGERMNARGNRDGRGAENFAGRWKCDPTIHAAHPTTTSANS